MTGARASYWGSVVNFGFREIIFDLAKRLDQSPAASFFAADEIDSIRHA